MDRTPPTGEHGDYARSHCAHSDLHRSRRPHDEARVGEHTATALPRKEDLERRERRSEGGAPKRRVSDWFAPGKALFPAHRAEAYYLRARGITAPASTGPPCVITLRSYGKEDPSSSLEDASSVSSARLLAAITICTGHIQRHSCVTGNDHGWESPQSPIA